jgi:uncharacterized Zn finger protein
MRYYGWRPYVPVAQRRREAERKMQRLRKKGYAVSPVVIEGRAIARTFWGKAWCDNLERYSDFANRLPRGRTYVRNGSVIDLQIVPGEVEAIVSGSEIYEVEVKVTAVPKTRWASICKDCAGAIESLVELLQGRFSKGVMERICQERTGLFPAPAEIEFRCSCPDWAYMCKHVAAVLYGIGSRLDRQPELLFNLRQVDEKDLIAKAGRGIPLTKKGPAAEKILGGEDLSELFGLEMAMAPGDVGPKGSARKRAPAGDRAKTSKEPRKPSGSAGRKSSGRGRRPSTLTRKAAKRPARKETKTGGGKTLQAKPKKRATPRS